VAECLAGMILLALSVMCAPVRAAEIRVVSVYPRDLVALDLAIRCFDPEHQAGVQYGSTPHRFMQHILEEINTRLGLGSPTTLPMVTINRFQRLRVTLRTGDPRWPPIQRIVDSLQTSCRRVEAADSTFRGEPDAFASNVSFDLGSCSADRIPRACLFLRDSLRIDTLAASWTSWRDHCWLSLEFRSEHRLIREMEHVALRMAVHPVWGPLSGDCKPAGVVVALPVEAYQDVWLDSPPVSIGACPDSLRLMFVDCGMTGQYWWLVRVRVLPGRAGPELAGPDLDIGVLAQGKESRPVRPQY
jgi:hypothetical protein